MENMKNIFPEKIKENDSAPVMQNDTPSLLNENQALYHGNSNESIILNPLNSHHSSCHSSTMRPQSKAKLPPPISPVSSSTLGRSSSSNSSSKSSFSSKKESSIKKFDDPAKMLSTPSVPLYAEPSNTNVTHHNSMQVNEKHRRKNLVAPAITEYFSAPSGLHANSATQRQRHSVNISSVSVVGSPSSAFQPRPDRSSMRILPPPLPRKENEILPPPPKVTAHSKHSFPTPIITPPVIRDDGILPPPLPSNRGIIVRPSPKSDGGIRVRKTRSASVAYSPLQASSLSGSIQYPRTPAGLLLPFANGKQSFPVYKDGIGPPPTPSPKPPVYPTNSTLEPVSPSLLTVYPDGIGPPSTPTPKLPVYPIKSPAASTPPLFIYPDGITPPPSPPSSQISLSGSKFANSSVQDIVPPPLPSLSNCSSDSRSYSGISDDITPPPGIPETGISRVPEWFEKRTAHFNELLDTERTYVKLLDRLSFYFQKNIHDKKDLNVTRDQQLKLFSNLGQIFELHKMHLLPMLEEISNSWYEGSSVGKIFCEFSSSFKCYVIFLTNHDTAVNLYKELKVKNKSFKRFMEAVEFSKVAEGLSFESLLILPVQRLPRYSLLLNDLIKTTPKEHPDYEYLQKAKNAIGEVITEINSRKKAEENEVKLRELEHLMDVSKGYFEKGKKGRLFHSEGDLQFDGKSYHFFAFEDSVYLAKPNGTKFKIKGLIEIMNSEFNLVEMGIEFMIKKEHHLFSFKTLLERDLFMKYIKESQGVLAEEEEKKSHEHGYNKKDKNPLKAIVKYHMRSASKLSVLKLSEFKKVSGFATLPQNCVMTVNSICEAIDAVSAFLGKFNPQIDMAVKKGLAEVAHCFQQFFVEFMRVFTQYATAYIKIKQIVEILFVTPEFSPFIKTFEEGHSCSIIRLLAIPTEIVSVDTSFLKDLVGRENKTSSAQPYFNTLKSIAQQSTILKDEIEKILNKVV